MIRRLIIVYFSALLLLLVQVLPSVYATSPSEPPVVTFSKTFTKAGKAYTLYYTALMKGALEEARKLVVRSNHKEFDSGVGEKMAAYFQKHMPRNVRFLKEIELGENATITVEGRTEKGRGRGSVKMKFEDNRWKVVRDKWKF